MMAERPAEELRAGDVSLGVLEMDPLPVRLPPTLPRPPLLAVRGGTLGVRGGAGFTPTPTPLGTSGPRLMDME